jgi:hypothetical protein
VTMRTVAKLLLFGFVLSRPQGMAALPLSARAFAESSTSYSSYAGTACSTMMGKIWHPGVHEKIEVHESSGRRAEFICDASAEEQHKIDREFQENEFEVKKRIFGVKYPWQYTVPYSSYPYSHPERSVFIDSENSNEKGSAVSGIPEKFLGRWSVKALRTTVDASPGLQIKANILCPLQSQYDWQIAIDPNAGPTLIFDGNRASLSIDKVENQTLFFSLQRPLDKNKTIWSINMSVTADAIRFSGLAHLSVFKYGKPAPVATYQLTGQLQQANKLESQSGETSHERGK